MTEMIKRLAKALKSAMQDSGAVSLVANGPNGEAALEQFFEVLAMDAIEAMREPTDAMCEAAEWHQQSEVNQYHAAIDAALNEKSPAAS